MTKDEFKAPMYGLQEARDFVLSKDGLQAWFLAVQDLPAGVWAEAVIAFLRCDTGTYRPTPAQVRRYAGVYGLTPEERADLIWAKVVEAMRRHSRVQFDDPAANLAIRNCGGMVAMRDGVSGELHFRKTAFVKAYAACVRANAGDARVLDCRPEELDLQPLLMVTGLPQSSPALPLSVIPADRIEHHSQTTTALAVRKAACLMESR